MHTIGKVILQGFCAGLGIGVVLLAGGRFMQPQPLEAQEATPEVVRAKRFVLVDDQGVPRAVLHMNNNQPQFALADSNRRIRAMMQLDAEGQPLFALADAKGGVRYSAAMSKGDEMCGIHLYDEKAQPRAGMTMLEEGGSMFYLGDTAGRRRQCLYLTPKDVPCLTQYDAEGRGRVGIQTDSKGNPRIMLLHPDTTSIWEAPPAK